MVWEKEAYSYEKYFGSFNGAKVRPIYCPFTFTGYFTAPKNYSPLTARSYDFLNQPESQNQDDSIDFFQQKLGLAQDKTDLILDQIRDRDSLKYDNLDRLYEDLLRLDNWRLEHDPSGYLVHDKMWQDFSKMELDIRAQIRRELNDFAKDTAFPGKDLRESLLEFKLQKSKSDMLGGGLEEMMEPDGSSETNRGDYDPPQPYS